MESVNVPGKKTGYDSQHSWEKSLSHYCLKAFIAYSTITNWHHSKIKSQCCMNSQKYKIIIIIILGTTFKYVTCIILYT